MVFGKKAEVKTGWVIAGLVALALIFNVGGVTDTAKGWLGEDSTAPAEDITGEKGILPRCYIEDTTLTVGPGEQMFAPTTKATTSYHRLIKNGVDKGLYLDGSTLTVNPGDNVAIYWAENDTTYYAAKQEFAIPCAGEVTAGEMPDSNAYKLYSNGTDITIRVFNTNDGNKNADGTNQTLSAGDVETLEVQLRGKYEEAMSPYGDIIVVCEGNDTVYDDLILGKYPTETMPSVHKLANSDRKAWTYRIPNLISNAQIDTTLVIDVDDTNGPDATSDKTDHDILVSFYDEDWYQDSSTGLMMFGVETDEDADVGFAPRVTSPTATTIHTD